MGAPRKYAVTLKFLGPSWMRTAEHLTSACTIRHRGDRSVRIPRRRKEFGNSELQLPQARNLGGGDA